ncbi:DUF2599 domain-containing protein [Pseudomonas sp. RC2C2]|uniref:DUF2599 domain-containing protein n=1 Tax=Pseudomonas sp. RC2C2 TaxID=2834408 RepID=UPI001BD0C6DB|nr:DUF2599 domain-containing protein [Pseudomonas sp. RC2C2]
MIGVISKVLLQGQSGITNLTKKIKIDLVSAVSTLPMMQQATRPARFGRDFKAVGWLWTRPLHNKTNCASLLGQHPPRGTFPIRAFFYTSGGLENAKAAQLDYQTTSGHFAPIIQLTLPTRSAEDATFKYNSADQVAAPKDTDTAELTNKCSSYIQSASWIKRYDPGTEQDEWTLSLVPTPCGREIKADQTQAFYDELVQKYGSDAEWQENDGGGMRRQLVCHLTTTRSKEMWNLEPFRPEVSHQDSVAAGCNAIAKFIKSATWINRYDPGTQKNEWTLSVVPSVRGRNITPADTDNFYKELLALKGQDWQWRDNEKSSGSMRRQLVCLVDNYRSKQEWNLEPFRPYVTHEQATAKHCNPL